MPHNGRVLLKAGYLKNIRPATELGFEKLICRFTELPFWNGRHLLLPGKEQMPIAHPSSPAFSNTYVACCFCRPESFIN